MRTLGVFLSIISFSAALLAQEKQSLPSRLAQKGILNHMDVGVTAGTMGIGIDLAVPVTDYVRIRAGYSYMPRFTIKSNFPIETSNGGFAQSISKDFGLESLDKEQINTFINNNSTLFEQPQYQDVKDFFVDICNLEEINSDATMGFKPNLHQFRFLVDVMPFRNNKHWSFTTGFFAGPSNIASASNLEKETTLLRCVLDYNNIYIKTCDQSLPDIYMTDRCGTIHDITSMLKKAGVAGFPLGFFEDGDKAMMVPAPNATVRAEMEISKIRPYIGFGYNTHLSRNKKWNMNVDAGVMFLCGKPRVYVDNVYKIDVKSINIDEDNFDIVHPNEDGSDFVVDEPLSHIDLVRDMYNMPNGKVRDMVNTISKFKVYPNLSVTFSYRLY